MRKAPQWMLLKVEYGKELAWYGLFVLTRSQGSRLYCRVKVVENIEKACGEPGVYVAFEMVKHVIRLAYM